MSSLLPHYLRRARVAYQESGPAGVARRAVRVGLSKLRDRMRVAERTLYYTEARARLTDETRQAALATAAMRDRHRGQRAFILATGPSINAPGVDLEALGGELTFGVNSFYQHPIVDRWQPTYMSMTDFAYFSNGAVMDEFFAAVRRRVGRSEFFVPAQFFPEIREHGWLPLERVHGVAMDGNFGEHPWADIDPTMMPMTPNILMFSIAMAIHLGCSPIVLLGADNDWLARPFDGKDLIPHFYEQNDFDLSETPFHQEFHDYHDVIRYCHGLWSGYKNLRRIAARRGLEVVNASPGSYLDVFPRVTFAQALAAR